MPQQESTNFLPVAGRVLMALIFIVSGLGKVATPAMTIGYISSTGAPLPEIGYALALVVELGGGLLILLGYQARPTAIVMALWC
jgi:putative oxidoreductase